MGLDIFVRSSKQDSIDINWRKINFVMGWLENVYDYNRDDINGTDILIGTQMVKDLKERCENILFAKRHNDNWQELGQTLLPTAPGFFFGWYEYDKYYLTDIEQVYSDIVQMEKEFSTSELIFHIWF